MRHKTNNLPTRVWTYGCRPPISGADIVSDQLWRAHRYANALVEIERGRREQYRAARLSESPEQEVLEWRAAELTEQIEAQRNLVKAERRVARKRTPTAAPAKEQLAQLQEQRRDLFKQIRAERVRLAAILGPANTELSTRIAWRLEALGRSGPRVREQVRVEVLSAMFAEASWPPFWRNAQQIELDARKATKAARANSGLYPGTYLLVDRAADAMRRNKSDPRFRHWSGKGRIGVHLEGGITVAELYGGEDTRLRLKRIWTGGRSGKRHGGIVSIRVGSSRGREPIWAEFPVLLHRELPRDAVIKDAWILVRKDGPRIRYELQLVCEAESFAERPAGTGTVAVDLGWRVMPDGNLRVGYSVDDRKRSQQLLQPARLRERLRYADTLRAISDTAFNRALAVARWARRRGHMPEVAREATEHMHQWRSHAKLARVAAEWAAEAIGPERIRELWSAWRTERLATKLDLLGSYAEIGRWARMQGLDTPQSFAIALEWWRRKNHHLHEWEARQRAKALGWRRNLYRIWAAELAQNYETVVISNIDLRKLAKSAKPEQESADHLHYIQRVAAPSELRTAMRAAGGARVVEEPAASATRTCHVCGTVNDNWEARDRRVQQCTGCEAEWDQDENACRVLLARYFERCGDDRAPGWTRGSDNPARREHL